ncbi:MAG TPA: helix-turn-helix domain-containing protein [Pirellulales bacterium]|jgi:excisionase family DNA binding protein|nr:helix-turn-helix domain-containing protein [Pirellulales bacterium]
MAGKRYREVTAVPPLLSNGEVLTLGETAAYLRISEEAVKRLASEHGLPGRHIDDDWRFLKSAVQDWLRRRGNKESLLRHAGDWADDPMVAELFRQIYAQRGRPMTEEG